MSELTMVLVNWARTEQLKKIVQQLREQTIQPKIFVWNNNPGCRLEHDLADLVINSSANRHCWPTVMLWQMAETPYVARMDDDIYFADTKVLEDSLEVLKQQSDATQIVGAWGVNLYADADYFGSQHLAVPIGQGQQADQPCDMPVDIVKGKIMLLRREAADKLSSRPVRIHPHDNHFDLYVSNTLAGRRRFWHTLAGCFWSRELKKGRLIDLPDDRKGYCGQRTHKPLRNKICDAWVRQCDPDPRVRKKPPPRRPKRR